MLERNITITLEKAKEWYNSDNATLKKVALQAFSEKELKPFDFTTIKTFEDALKEFNYNEEDKQKIIDNIKKVSCFSKASAAMIKLNIIRKVLNQGYDLHLTNNANNDKHVWNPYFKLVPIDSNYFEDELNNDRYEKLGKITSEGIIYDVLYSDITYSLFSGFGNFESINSIGNAFANTGFLGCATEEVAKHLGKYFGMLVIEAMYGDIIDLN